MDVEKESWLVRLCIDEACRSRETVEKWRRQRRSLERMPSHLADALIRRLLRRRLLFPSLLEVFKHSVEDIDFRGESSVDAEWMAYIGSFSNLRSLNLSDCYRISSSAIWAITGMTSLKELDLSRCSKVTDAGIRHLLSIPTLEKLWISETGATHEGIVLLASLKNLSLLDLGGLPLSDRTLKSLQVLTKMEYLDLWGSNITDRGAAVLLNFPKLSFLNLTWTSVSKVPSISSLECLYLSNCTISSIVEGGNRRASLRKLVLSGATFTSEMDAFLLAETSSISFLDVSNSSLKSFSFLEKMKMLEHLDLSSTVFGDDFVYLVVCFGENLRNLNLRNTRISSAGVGILAGHVPHLETLSLSQTFIDDLAISYIGTMASIKALDLSSTNIRGLIRQEGLEPDLVPSLTALQNLNCLERLNLEQTQLKDAALYPLLSFKELTHLSLRSPSLTDAVLHQFSSLTKLETLGIRDAVLTNQALDSLKPRASVKILDLRGCWLLTKDAIGSLCKRYPHIEVRHELFRASPSEQNISRRPSHSRTYMKTSGGNKKPEKLPISQCFVDQRLKYDREELLALEDSPLSLALRYLIPESLAD